MLLQPSWQSVQVDVRKYIRVTSRSNNTLASWNLNLFTLRGTPPLLMLPSKGLDDTYNTDREYIQGRFRGRNMVYLETEYRFQLSRNRLIKGMVFVNVQSFSNKALNAYNSVKPGYGIGLRIKVNKH